MLESLHHDWSRVLFRLVQPPYETEQQRVHVARVMRRLEDEEELTDWEREFKECYRAGGGSRSSCYRFLKYARNQRDRVAKLYRTQINGGVYLGCAARSAGFLCVKGIKPEAAPYRR